MNADANGNIAALADIDISNLLGYWVNVNAHSDYIPVLSLLSEQRQVRLRLHSARAGVVTPVAEASAAVYAIAQSPSARAAGFCALYTGGDSKITIAANEKLGILVLQCYTQFNDNHRHNILTREFYRRECSGGNCLYTSGATVDPNSRLEPPCQPREENFTHLVGQWNNAFDGTSWIKSFVIENNEGDCNIKFAFQPNPGQWEASPLELFVLDADELGFIFHSPCGNVNSQCGNVDSDFFAYSNKGLIVMSGFHTGGRPGGVERVMSREFYFRADSSPHVGEVNG